MKSLAKKISNWLCKFSGEDFFIVSMCDRKIRLYFSIIGLFVLVILICCFVSAVYFTEHLFHNGILDFGVGLIWGYIVTNLYVLLLYTITPTLLPIKHKRSKFGKFENKGLIFNTSMILRIGIVLLLAIINTQMLNIFLLKPTSTDFAEDVRKLLATNVWAWLITLCGMGVFILPIYFKYSIRKLGDFYDKKAKIKLGLVEDHYTTFKQQYKILLEDKITDFNRKTWEHLDPYLNKLKTINESAYQRHLAEISEELKVESIDKYEYWADPPYRTIRKSSEQVSLDEKDLLNYIYPPAD